MNIPSCSKVLFTSRVGLGELELRYVLPDFDLRDANILFRSLADVCGYDSLKKFNNLTVNRYCKALSCNPLLIKWFVQAVGKGACPDTIISLRGFEEALTFCYANVYDRLDDLARQIVAVLLGAKRELTKTQLQVLTGLEHIQFLRGLQNLIRSCLVERIIKDDGTVKFQIGGLVYEYLSRNHPPDDRIVLDVREKIKTWQQEQDKSYLQTKAFRYGPKFLHVETADERISAQHLFQARQAAEANDFDKATSALKIAKQLTPTWWEIYRIEARILELQNKPIYEIENTYENSIKCKDTDINRYYYAVYLNRQGEYERALEQIDAALQHEEAIQSDLLGLRGLVFMRMGRLDDAIPALEEVWGNSSQEDPVPVVRSRGTQLADAYRRHAEQMFLIGKKSQIVKDLSRAVEVVDKTMNDCGCDPKLAEMAIDILGQALRTLNIELGPQEPFKKLADRWDSSEDFQGSTLVNPKIVEHFRKNPKLEVLLPKLYKYRLSIDISKRYSGIISSIYTEYGFIKCESLKTNIHFDRSSLKDSSHWKSLREGTSVSFEVIPTTKSPHAISMTLDSQA